MGVCVRACVRACVCVCVCERNCLTVSKRGLKENAWQNLACSSPDLAVRMSGTAEAGIYFGICSCPKLQLAR